MKLHSVLLGVALLLVTGCGDQPNASKPRTVYTFDCETRVSKPKSIMIYCADGGAYLEKITWNTWDDSGAAGSGTYSYNDCEPDCADGTTHSVPVKITLSDPISFKGEKFLSALHFETLDGAPLSKNLADTFDWDLSDFARAMDQQ